MMFEFKCDLKITLRSDEVAYIRGYRTGMTGDSLVQAENYVHHLVKRETEQFKALFRDEITDIQISNLRQFHVGMHIEMICYFDVGLKWSAQIVGTDRKKRNLLDTKYTDKEAALKVAAEWAALLGCPIHESADEASIGAA